MHSDKISNNHSDNNSTEGQNKVHPQPDNLHNQRDQDIHKQSLTYANEPVYSRSSNNQFGRDCMIAGFTTTSVINVYHH